MISIWTRILRKMPKLRHQIKIAHLKISEEQFLRKSTMSSFMFSVLFLILLFFAFTFLEVSMAWLPIVTILIFLFMFVLLTQSVQVQIKRRQKEIDAEVLFLGRFLLVKIDAGQPFFNALIDASKSRGMTASYIREIVKEVEFGMSIEKAIEQAIDLSPSKKMKRILFQVSNALKTGIDIGDSLRVILNDIAEEQVIEIKEYGKKMNSIAMFYMLLGIIIPSLVVTLFIVIASFTSIKIPFWFLFLAGLGIAFVQYIFIALFKSIRPAVGL